MSDPATPRPGRASSASASLEDLVEIGRGGFAVVYRACQPRFGRTGGGEGPGPAGADPSAVERFERECEAMGMLSSHPNIVTIFDAGVTDDGKPYLVMEYMPERQPRRPPGSGRPAALGGRRRHRGEAGRRAGRRPTRPTVLHRDVKPANVLLLALRRALPERLRPGPLRWAGQDDRRGHGDPAARPARRSWPAQPATPRSDVYSLGFEPLHPADGRRPVLAADRREHAPSARPGSPTSPSPTWAAEACPTASARPSRRPWPRPPRTGPRRRPRSARACASAQADAGVTPTTLLRIAARHRWPPPAGRPCHRPRIPTPPSPGRRHQATTSARTIRKGAAGTLAHAGDGEARDRRRWPGRGAGAGRRRWPPPSSLAAAVIGLVLFLALGDDGGEDDDDRDSDDDAPEPDIQAAATELDRDGQRPSRGRGPEPRCRSTADWPRRRLARPRAAAEAERPRPQSIWRPLATRHAGRWAISSARTC